MTDLSQDEIDSLMGGGGDFPSPDDTVAVAEEEESPAENLVAEQEHSWNVQDYDFKKPNRIPKEHKRTICMVHETFAQTVSMTLSAFLRTEVTVSLQEVEQTTFQEYTMSLTPPTCAATVDMQPLNGCGVVELNAALVYTMIDRMLGGSGSIPAQIKSFTDIELSIARKLLNTILKDLGDSWQQLLRINFGLKEMHSNPAFIRSIPSREVCLAAYIKVDVGDVNGLFTLCIPYVNLEPIAGKLKNEQFNSRYSPKQNDDVKEAHERNFSQITLEIKPILGSFDLSMRELLFLQPGDIIDIKQGVSDPIRVCIGGQEKFLATPGLRGKSKAIAIQGDIAKETDHYE